VETFRQEFESWGHLSSTDRLQASRTPSHSKDRKTILWYKGIGGLVKVRVLALPTLGRTGRVPEAVNCFFRQG